MRRVRERSRLRLRRGLSRDVKEATRSARRVTSSRSCLTSVWGGSEMAETVGVATSMTLSAMSASLFRSAAVSTEARTMRTFAGSLCRKSSRRKVFESAPAPSLSPRSCCIRRRSWVGFLSPSSSPLMSCCSLRCSEAAVRLMSSALSLS